MLLECFNRVVEVLFCYSCIFVLLLDFFVLLLHLA